MPRIFIAFPLPEAQREILAAVGTSVPGSEKFRWEAKHKLHLTAKFIGDIGEEQIEKIGDFLSSIVNQPAPVTKFTGLGFFGKADVPAILQVGLHADRKLRNMVREIEQFCVSILALPPELRRFNPHVTLLRIKPFYELTVLREVVKKELPEGEFNLSVLTLFRSELRPGGAEHSPLVSYELKS
jgi:2'-5' RNA ligase